MGSQIHAVQQHIRANSNVITYATYHLAVRLILNVHLMIHAQIIIATALMVARQPISAGGAVAVAEMELATPQNHPQVVRPIALVRQRRE